MSEIISHEQATMDATVCDDCGAEAGQLCFPACSSRWMPTAPTFDGVPPLPDGIGTGGDGYDWADALTGGCYVVPGWGRDGWDLGDWPYVIVCHYDGAQVYAVATYTEGDLTCQAFTTRAERDQATDTIAAWQWRHGSPDGPDDLPDHNEELKPRHRGPFNWNRISV